MPHARTNSRYGWVRDIPDFHDARLGLPVITKPFPTEIDLSMSTNMPEIYNQNDLGACTAHGIKRVVEYDNHLETGNFYDPSRLFIYYLERVIEGTVETDSGAQIRDGIKVVTKVGNIKESVWPYDPVTFTTPPQPIETLAQSAQSDRVLRYARVGQTSDHLMSVLAGPNGNDGRPIVFGFTVYESFEQDIGSDGVMPMPKHGESVLGGHCVAGTGYRYINGKLYLQCANSWGPEWGANGYFYMPMRYAVSAMASDFWVTYTTNLAA